MFFMINFFGSDFLPVNGPPGIENIHQHHRYAKGHIAHSSKGVMAGRSIFNGEGALQVEGGRIKRSMIKAGNAKQGKNS